MSTIIALGVVLLAFVFQARSAPSASTVNSDLQFLFQNDLNWPTASNHNGTILVSTASTNAIALASCKKLNEALLPTTGIFFKSDTAALMRYLAFNNQASPIQRFWVAGGKGALCQATSLQGGLQSVPCTSRLPAFCSQSAPYRPNTQIDPNPAFQVQVESQKLTVVGTRDHLSFRFIGIPYANPFARFSYSTPFTTSSPITINALSFGARCLQGGDGSEDCLFLNIFTPFLPASTAQASKSKKLKPVLFWIHGGGFTGGEGSDGIYDGGNMASRSDVVVVTINYRLGTLGFLALNDGVTKGNYGIADQVTALQWVKTHIADFGGDPSRVTIYGQSAGAGSVRALLGSPPAFGLFAGAIAQSNLGGFGYAMTYTEYLSIDQEFSSFASPLVQSVGCGNATDVLACLRSVPANTLNVAPTAPRYIVTDGKYITNSHLAVNGKGPTAPAHIIFGWMRDDGVDFIGSFPNANTTFISDMTAAGVSSDIAQKVASRPDLFPIPTSSNSSLNILNVTSRVGTDGEFLCIDQATAFTAAKHHTFPSVYAYQFDRSYAGFEPIPGTCEPPATAAFPAGDPNAPYFRCHSGDLYYTAGTLGQDSRPFRDAGDLLLSQTTVDSWGSFARTFNPNPSSAYLTARGYATTADALKKAGPWQAVGTGSTPLRLLDGALKSTAWREQAQCDLLGYPITTLFE